MRGARLMYVQALNENIRQGWKGLLGTQALSYLALMSVTNKKSFRTLMLGVTVLKLFLSLTLLKNKQACLSPSFFWLLFAGKIGAAYSKPTKNN
jgi:hypothetical protein